MIICNRMSVHPPAPRADYAEYMYTAKMFSNDLS